MAAAEPEPSVIASHIDVVYRVFGTRARTDGQKGLLRAFRRGDKAPRSVHAVKDVSFTAYHGEAIGIIGRNGSGKSTLLRAVAGLMPPTSGEVWAAGTPALLGVNAVLVRGLSGARNVYIGAQALGLSEKEVDEKFDEIVDFAEIGDAIHLPMSTYSSGMAARLRFAISTAAAPSVLVIDEALATGDAHFRAKSSERITAMREKASTVFIVSHSAQTIRQMCDRALWLHEGELVADGPAEDIVEAYTNDRRSISPAAVVDPPVQGVERWHGSTRHIVSTTISENLVEEGVDEVFLLRSEDPLTALAAVPVALRRSAPVLLGQRASTPPRVLKEMERLAPRQVVLVGAEGQLSDAAEQDVVDRLGEAHVVRVTGATNIDVAVELSDEVAGHDVKRVFVTQWQELADTFVAACAASWEDGVVLFVERDEVPDRVADRLDRLDLEEIVVVGDETKVGPKAFATLGRFAPSVRRLVGAPTDVVADLVTRYHPERADRVFVSGDEDLALGSTLLSAAGLVAAPVVLVDEDEVPERVHTLLRELQPSEITVVGGTRAVSPAARAALADYLVDEREEAEADLV